MDYQIFQEDLVQLLSKLTEGEKKVRLHKVEKNNGVIQEAVSLIGPKETVVPTIYLQEFYERYQGGESLETIAKEILEREEEEKRGVEFSLDSFEDYKKARTRIYYKLVNYQMNRVLLQKIPHVKYLDLAVVFYYRLESGWLDGATILIYNCNLEAWGIKKEQLVEDAVMNTSRKQPYTFQGVEALIGSLTGEAAQEDTREEMMYVLTNEEKCFGAAALLYPHVLSHIAKLLRRNFYVLPSSVHECILVPDQGQYSRFELMKTVKEVNQNQVEKEEILSYEVYYYDSQKEALML